MFANPNNPCGKVFDRGELEFVGDLCRRNGVIAVADEVYEYIIGPDRRHLSLAALPGLFDQTITRSSVSKTLFVTGWRVGWAVGPEEAMAPLGVKSDETYICASAPLQHAVGVGSIPGNAFFPTREETGLLRFCFAVEEG